MIFEKAKCKLPEALLRSIAGYIEENYEGVSQRGTYGAKAAQICECSLPTMKTPPCPPPMAIKSASLADMLKQEDAGFTENLLQRIDATGKKDSEIYKKALLSKQHFSKIRNNPNYKPTKPTAIALALALELDLEQTRDLIGRAGYALTNSSKFDLIIRYFIENGKYDLVEINMALYEFDQCLLGSNEKSPGS